MKVSGFCFPTGIVVLATMLMLLGWAVTAWADSGTPGYPDDPLRPMLATRDILIYVQMRPAVGPPYPTISITPGPTAPGARIKVESSIPLMVDYYFFYRGTHPYFVASSSINIWADTIRTLDVTDPLNNNFIDGSSGIGNATNNYCYFARAVDAVTPGDPSSWTFSAPSNVVCEWDYALSAPGGLTHWNQVSIPLLNNQTDTLAGWGNRVTGISEIDVWMPITQSYAMRALKSGSVWTSGGNRRTQYVRPYHITGATISGVLSTWGDRLPDICDSLRSNPSLTDLNNIVMQPAWHWFQDDSASSYVTWGNKLYAGTPATDYGVREILEWTAGSQSWTSRSLWDVALIPPNWSARNGVRVYKPFMLKRTYNNVPGGTGVPCWPQLVR